MKIKKHHLEHIKTQVDIVLEQYPNVASQYEKGLFANSDKVKNLQMRFCFDVAKAAKLNVFFCEELYSYLTDTHIFTALKHCLPKIEKEY
jgi:hypothetical protein